MPAGTTEYTRRGSRSSQSFAITSPATSPADGVVSLFSSGEGEPALESDELRGAIFTHYWVSALRGAGDANGDGRVTLAESYDFAYSQTLLRSTRASGALQHPAAVFDLREAAPIVLDESPAPARSSAFLGPRTRSFLVYALGSRTVVGEVWGSRSATSTSHSLLAGISLSGPPARVRQEPSSGSLRAKHARFAQTSSAPFPREEFATKGAPPFSGRTRSAWSFSVGASRLSTLGEMAGLRYSHQWDDFRRSPSVSAEDEGLRIRARRT